MMQGVRHYAYQKLLDHGWLLRRSRTGGWEAGRGYWDAAYLRRLGFHPATIVDVGVGTGTETLYAAFPDAYLVMIEPLAEFSKAIQTTLARRPGVHVPVAAGSTSGRRTIWIEPRFTVGSSLYERCAAERTKETRIPREVQVSTLDAIARELRFPAPYGLKLDTEGAELEIINGATDLLRDTLFVIAETSVTERFADSYSFAELVGRMDQLGFRVCDILDIGRAESSEVTFFDLVFRRREPL
jgi:FkbM family methyltransferase